MSESYKWFTSELETVRDALKETERNYVKSRHFPDIDVPKRRVGNALSELENEGLVEKWSDGNTPTWRVLV